MAPLRFMLPLCGALAAVAAIVGFFFGGGAGALGAAAGVLLITGLFVLSTLLLLWVERVNRAMMLPAALGTYTFKLFLLVAVLNPFWGWAGFLPMVWGVAAGIIGWVCGYAWWVWHAKVTLDV
jgi:hypothetical protein